ncbi:hypothetical protein BYT27DRAFT_7098069 [Phlegmacium glaucopus]|nr:hypothetical protein BYT27DRAFT_7098069 [Phlegmacium glaucopus]
MSTLQLVLNKTHYDLWSWQSEGLHHTAFVIGRFRKRVYLAVIGPTGEKATDKVVIKLGWGEKEQESLQREFDFYMHDLYHLQGEVVPQCRGIYRGRVNGLPSGCLVLQYCDGPPITNGSGFFRQLFFAARKLHEAGVVHGDLLETRNILQMDESPRIIDFSTATRHHCQNGVPTHPYLKFADGIHCCPELAEIAKVYEVNHRALTLNENMINQFRTPTIYNKNQSH